MAIERRDIEQTTCNANVIINGERRLAASAACSIRAGGAMNISIDLAADVETTDGDKAEIAEMFGEYIAAEILKAAGLGIPVKLPGK